jgi:hypothetical protein
VLQDQRGEVPAGPWLTQRIAEGGLLGYVHCDAEGELTVKAMRDWLGRVVVMTLCIEPRSVWERACGAERHTARPATKRRDRWDGADSRAPIARGRPLGAFVSGPPTPKSVAAEWGARRTEPFNSGIRTE